MCADSAHKTLPAITGAGYLHISGEYVDRFRDAAHEYMGMFASTSPSFLISMSLDNCNRLLSKTFKEDLMQCINKLNQLKTKLSEQGINVRKSEPLKLVTEHNMGKENAVRELKKFSVYPEFTDDNFVVFMISPYNSDDELEIIKKALIAMNECNSKNNYSIPIYRAHEAKRVISIREAVFSKKELISAIESLGRIYADTSVSCPPAVPIAICGELIDEEMIRAFQDYNIENVRVVQLK